MITNASSWDSIKKRGFCFMCTHQFRLPDEAILSEPAKSADDPLGYSIESLLWLVHHASNPTSSPWTREIPAPFLDAVRHILLYFDESTNMEVQSSARNAMAAIAIWRGDIVEPADHPLSHLGRLMAGNPGEHLEYKGPVFQTTIDRVLEGLTHEYVMQEWHLENENQALMILALCCVCVGVVAQTAYWAVRGHGDNLGTELARTFRQPDCLRALRGQLGNLVLSAQALSWNLVVSYIPEAAVPTPDFTVRTGDHVLWVEATSVDTTVALTDDRAALRQAIATAWSAKHRKFSLQSSPGLITVDLSGIYVSREHSAILKRASVQRHNMALPTGGQRCIGVYPARDDLEFLAVESYNRDLIGVLASAVHSSEAIQRGIKGVIAFYGQEIWVDTINQTINRPQKGLLVWRGNVDEPEFQLACQVAQPAIPSPVPANMLPPIWVHLV